MSETVHYEAVLHPHRSLSPRGFAILMVVAGVAALMIGLFYVASGAWPVLGFYGLEVAALYVGFRWSYAQARRTEIIRVTDEDLIVVHAAPDGTVQEWRFKPYWVRVVAEGDDEGLVTRLLLVSHGQWLEIAAFLGPTEREDLARDLRAALRGVQP